MRRFGIEHINKSLFAACDFAANDQENALLRGNRIPWSLISISFTFCCNSFCFSSSYIEDIWHHCFLRSDSVWIKFQGFVSGMLLIDWWHLAIFQRKLTSCYRTKYSCYSVFILLLDGLVLFFWSFPLWMWKWMRKKIRVRVNLSYLLALCLFLRFHF